MLALAFGSAYGLVVVCLLLAPVFRTDRGWSAIWGYTLVTGLLALGVLVWRFFLPKVLPWFGAYEAILVLLAFAWLEALMVRLLHISRQRRPEA